MRTLHVVRAVQVTYEICDTCKKSILPGSAMKWISARKSDNPNPVNMGCLCYHQTCEIPEAVAKTLTVLVAQVATNDGGVTPAKVLVAGK